MHVRPHPQSDFPCGVLRCQGQGKFLSCSSCQGVARRLARHFRCEGVIVTRPRGWCVLPRHRSGLWSVNRRRKVGQVWFRLDSQPLLCEVLPGRDFVSGLRPLVFRRPLLRRQITLTFRGGEGGRERDRTVSYSFMGVSSCSPRLARRSAAARERRASWDGASKLSKLSRLH